MRTLTLAVASILLFAGCSSDAEPIEPPATGKPVATPPSPPTLPDLATRDTPEGAGEFVRFWVDSFNYAALTGRTSPMKNHARPCKPCGEYAEDFEALAPSDRPEGPAWNLKRVTVVLSRRPIEVETLVKIEGEAEPVPLTFVLNDGVPFKLTDIYRRK